MNTGIVSIDAITMEELLEAPATHLINETEAIHETPLPVNRRFGIVDMWKIRNTKRHFTFYR